MESKIANFTSFLINEKIKMYKDKFSVKDDLDLVIMCCLELATDNINQHSFLKQDHQKTAEALKIISGTLNSAILKSEE